MKNTKIRSGAVMKQPTQLGDKSSLPASSVSTDKIQDLAVTPEKLSALLQALLFQENLIDNPEGLLFQRTAPGTPTNIANDAFGPDRWNILTSANNVAVSRSTDSPSGASHAIKLDKATAVGYFGMTQMKEANESIALRNKSVVFSGSIKTESLEVSQVRISILGWTGTADTITSDVVSAWGSTPTYIANVVSYGTMTLDLTNSYQEFDLTAIVGGTCNNLIFFIHTTNSEAVGDSIFVSAMRAYASESAMPYIRRSDAKEIFKCQRYFEKSYELGTAPGTVTNVAALAWGGVGSSNRPPACYPWAVTKRSSPAFLAYNPRTGAQTSSAIWDSNTGSTDYAQAVTVSDKNFNVSPSSGTPPITAFLFMHWTVSAEL